MLSIDRVFVFVAVDEDGSEGVPAFQSGEMVVPMMGCDVRRVEQLHAIATRASVETGKVIELREFRLHASHGLVPLDVRAIEGLE